MTARLTVVTTRSVLGDLGRVLVLQSAMPLKARDDIAAPLYPCGRGCYLINMKQPVVCCSPEVMGGTAVFYGTRVPVQTLLDYIEASDTIDDFLEGFRR